MGVHEACMLRMVNFAASQQQQMDMDAGLKVTHASRTQ